jgi:hypothetical protein
MNNGKFAVGFLNLILTSILLDAEDLVVIFSLTLFQLQLSIAEILGQVLVSWIGFS